MSDKTCLNASRQDAPVVSPDLEAAAEFLAWLDPESPGFTFQTFDDSPAKRPELARVLNGSLDRHALELQRLQRSGAGVFVTINETDLRGRKTENIERVRALFVDLDGAPLEQLGRFSLMPSCVVDSSPGRFHAYWLVHDVSLDEFKPLQQRLALLVGGDKAVCDLPHVMRLAGFLHQKVEPLLTAARPPAGRLVYSRDEIVAALGRSGSETPRRDPPRDEPDVIGDYLKNYKGPGTNTTFQWPEHFQPKNDQVDLDELRVALAFIDPDPREEWLSVGMALHSIDAWDEWIAWSKGSQKFDQKDAARVWRSFGKRDDGVGVGTIFHMAKQQGWRPAGEGRAARRRRRADDDLHAAEALDDGIITQDGVALVFAERYAGKLKFCHSTGAWFEWDGSRWRRNDEDVAFQYARTLGREASEGEKANVRKEVRKVAFAGAVERFARGDARLSATADRWDADPWLLGTPGGTVNLRTGELLLADPADNITKLTAVAPVEDENCPLWLAFLHETFQDNEDEVAFIKSWCGYCLTGDVSEHALLFGHGAGGNGKGVLANAVAGVMGDYAATAPMDMFLDQQYRGHPTELADLHGRRLITAQEVEPNQVWSQVRITSLTGGDKIKARFMREDFFEFSPQFKLMFMGNDKPSLKTVNDAIRRRVNLLPFNHKPAKVDPRLGEKLREEWPGILRWMINGCLEWQANGLKKPQSVKDATESYLVSEDLLLVWLEERCIVEPEEKRAAHDKAEGYKGPKTARSELFASWRDFCNRMRRPVGNAKAFYENLERRGFSQVKTEGYYFIKFLTLRPFVDASF